MLSGSRRLKCARRMECVHTTAVGSYYGGGKREFCNTKCRELWLVDHKTNYCITSHERYKVNVEDTRYAWPPNILKNHRSTGLISMVQLSRLSVFQTYRMNDKQWMWKDIKGRGRNITEMLYYHMPGGLSGSPTSGSRIEPGTYQSVTAWANLLVT
jgi:hypothetical protein